MTIHPQAEASFHVAFVLDKQAQKNQHDAQAKAELSWHNILDCAKGLDGAFLSCL